MRNGKRRQPTSPAKWLLDADRVLRIAADQFCDAEDQTLDDLRNAAQDFAEAWKACDRGKGRP